METEIVFLLDRSGSMGSLEGDTIGGFNSFLHQQQEKNGSSRLTTILFDDTMETLHNREVIKGIHDITKKEYFVRGMTALLDAVGFAITHMKQELEMESVLKGTPKQTNVLFVVTTDGMENSSHEYRPEQVKKMVEECKEMGWDFIFLGAGIDAFTSANSIGIDLSASHSHTGAGYGTMFNAVSNYAHSHSCGVRGAETFSKTMEGLE